MMPIHLNELISQSEEQIHTFIDQLAYSNSMENWAFNLKSLHYFYPDTVSWKNVIEMMGQRNGNDITLERQNGVTVVQLKNRRVDYGDFLIEYKHVYSDFEHLYKPGNFTIPGWIEVYLNTVDDILYNITPALKSYRISFLPLYEAWINNSEQWIESYQTARPSRNVNPHRDNPNINVEYYTFNCAIPFFVLKKCGVLVDFVQFSESKVVSSTNIQYPLL